MAGWPDRPPRQKPLLTTRVVLILFLLQSLLGSVITWQMRGSACALAYIDPGSGALLVQVLVSVAVGLLVFVRRIRELLLRTLSRWWRRIPPASSGGDKSD